jgi:hypothetical protein
MTEMPAFQVVLTIVAEEEPAPGELEAAAEVVLAALQRKAASIAMGPVVSVNFERSSVEAECTVSGEGADEVHGKIARIFDVMLAAANSFEYYSSKTERLELALA